MTDFNLFNNITDKPVINSTEEYVIQQIELLFNTDTESVLGDLQYGSNYDRYVYGIGVSNTALENKVLSDIKTLDLCGYRPNVSVTFIEGTIRDIALIDISLTEGTSGIVVFSKTFMIK
jgi:hypothetical protein